MNRPEYVRGFYAAGDQIANFINALDSEGMSGKDVRSAIYGKCLEIRPPMTDRLIIGHGFTLGPTDSIPTLKPGVKLKFVESGDIPFDDHRCGYTRRPILIALTSPAMGSGKSTVANHLVTAHGFVLLKFAGPLKSMARTLLQEIGDDLATIERRLEGDLKETVIPTLQVTARQLCQRLGTEFGRLQLHENVWADVTRDRALQFLRAGRSVVVDDMRYLNELAAVKSAGGIPVRVTRPGATVTSAHSSEGELNGESLLTLANNGTVSDLHRLVTDTLAHLLDTQ